MSAEEAAAVGREGSKECSSEGGDTRVVDSVGCADSPIAVVGLKRSSRNSWPMPRSQVLQRSGCFCGGAAKTRRRNIERPSWDRDAGGSCALARFCGRSSARRALHIPLSTRPTTPWPVSSSSRATPAPSVRPEPPFLALSLRRCPSASRRTSVPAAVLPPSFPRHSAIQLFCSQNRLPLHPANLRQQFWAARKLVVRISATKMSSQPKPSPTSSSRPLGPPAWTR